MSIFKTYKAISHRGNYKGVKYELAEFTTYYYPYNYIDTDKGEMSRENVDLSIFTLRYGKDKYGFSCYLDQFGNKWYIDDENYRYIAYADGKPLNVVPTSYYAVCQLISKNMGLLIKEDFDYYEYCYNLLVNTNNSPMEEYVSDYENMFETKYNIGQRIFYVVHYDGETRNGDRYQIHDMIVRGIEQNASKIYYLDYNPKKFSGCSSSKVINQDVCGSSVEELCKRYAPNTLYMWNRNGGCSIEPCNSTETYLRYNKED